MHHKNRRKLPIPFRVALSALLPGICLGDPALPPGGIVLSSTPPIHSGGAATIDAEGGVIDGNGYSGLFVQGGALTIQDATLMNFATQGGDGSGGGAGLGGAVFVNSGAVVTLNNVNFFNNSATGGKGGVGEAGGSLNNLFNSGAHAGQAASGYTPTRINFTDIEGTIGTKGLNGAFNANGIGAFGGNGGAGGSGGDRSESLILSVTAASTDVAAVISEMVAAGSNPFTANVAIGLAAQVISAGINLGNAVASLAYFDQALANGQIGLGGSGGAGGNGGMGGFGYGGGAGGEGGRGGNGGANWGGSAYKGGAAGGDGGDGGDGGLGGFGAGGGRGGDGGAGGGGAGVTATAGSPATPAVTEDKVIPAVYSKGYYIDNDANPATPAVWVELEGGLREAVASYSFDHDNNLATPPVTVEAKQTSEEKIISVVVTPAQPAIAASEGGQRPNGKAGAAGAGGNGGFGGGTGAAGDGANAQAAGGSGGNGMGGAIFVRSGGTLVIQGNATFGANNARGGNGQAADPSHTAGSSGVGVGTDLMMMKGSTVILDAGAGNTITFNGKPFGTSIADDSASSMDSNIASGDGAGLTVQSGLVVFNGANTYSGQTKIAGGVLQAQDGDGIYYESNINFAGGVLQSSGEFLRYLGTGSDQVQWTGSGGFAAIGDGLTVRLSGGLAIPNYALAWGAGAFIPPGSALLFGSDTATAAVVLENRINLNGGARTILVTDNVNSEGDEAFIVGTISNGALVVGDASHTGKLTLTANNTYANGTTINGGLLALAGNGKLNANGALTNNANFDFSQTGDQAVGSLSGGATGKILAGDNTLTINQSADGTYAGTIVDGGIAGGLGAKLVKQGNAALTLTGANTYTGDTTVKAGTLTLSGAGSLATPAVSIDAGATMNDLNGGLTDTTKLVNAGTFNIAEANETVASVANTGTIDGTATLTAATYALNNGSVVNANLGTGAVTANGNVALNGTSSAATIRVETGTTTLGSAERLIDSTDLTIDADATLVLGGNEKLGTLAGAGSLANAGGRLTADDGSFSGVISGTGGLTKVSTGALVLTGENTYTGSTKVAEGTLELSGNGSLVSNKVGVSAGAKLANLNGGLASDAALTNDGTVDLGSADDTIATLKNTGTIDGTSTLTAANYALNDGSVINAHLGTGVVVANGAVALNGTSSAEEVQIASGTTTLGSAERLLDSTQLTVADGATLVVGGDEKIGVLLGAGGITVDAGSLKTDSGDFSGNISGAKGLVKVSDGTLVLSGDNGYTGTTQIDQGKLTLTGTLASRTVNVAVGTVLENVNGGLAEDATLSNDGTVELGTDDTIQTLNNTGTLNDAPHTLTAITYNLNNGSVINAHLGTGTVNANGAVALNGTSNAQTFNVQSGTTTLGSAERLRDNTDLTVAKDATLVLGGGEKIGSLLGAGNVTNSGHRLTADDGDFSGVVQGTGGVTKVSAGELTLGGANTYTGSTLVNAGTVNLTGSLASAPVTVAAGATLNDIAAGLAANTVATIDGTLVVKADEAIDTLNGSGSTVLANARLTTNQGNYSGVISGKGGLTKVSSGELTLSGANTYTGSTLVNAGTINLTGSLVSPVVTIAKGATLNNVNAGLADDAEVDVNGSLLLKKNEILNTLTGSGSTVLDNASLTLNAGNFSGVLSGTGALTKVTAAELTLSGANTYAGKTAIDAGTLKLTGSLASTDIGIAAGATLESTNSGLATNAKVTNAGVLNIAGANDTIASLVNRGTVHGTAKLTAATYALNHGSVVNANLGAGVLTTAGDVMLAGTSDALEVNVTTNSTLTLVSAERLNDAASVTVDGKLVLAGGDETFHGLAGSGNVSLSGHNLYVTDGGRFSGTIDAPSTGLTSTGDLALSGTTTTSSTEIAQGGTLTVNAGSNFTSNSVNVTNGALVVEGGSNVRTATLTINSGSSLDITNSNDLTYTTLNGSGTVNSGGAFVNKSGGTVAGNLTFSGDFTNSGNLAPGNSPGTTTISGNYTESGTLHTELAGTAAGSYDQVRVGGTINVTPGSALVVETFNGVAPALGQVYQAFSTLAGAPKAINGTFSSVKFDADGLAGSAAAVTNAAVVLDVSNGQIVATGLNANNSTFADLGTTRNQASAAAALFKAAQVGQNQIDTRKDIGRFARMVIDGVNAPSVDLARITPDYYAGLADYSVLGERTLADLQHDRVGARGSERGGFAGFMSADVTSADNVDLVRRDSYAGLDFALGRGFVAGVAVARNDGRIGQGVDRTEASGTLGQLFLTKSLSPRLQAYGSLGYGAHDFETRRLTMEGVVLGDTDSAVFGTTLGADYRVIERRQLSVNVRAGIRYSDASVEAFTEKGTRDAFRIGDAREESFDGELGASAVWKTELAGRTLSFELSGALTAPISEEQRRVHVHMVESPAMAYALRYKDEDVSGTVGATVGYQVGRSSLIYGGYEARASSKSGDFFNVGLRVKF